MTDGLLVLLYPRGATCGLVVEHDVVTLVAPYAKWARGKTVHEVVKAAGGQAHTVWFPDIYAHCGDHTDSENNPASDLCTICAKVDCRRWAG